MQANLTFVVISVGGMYASSQGQTDRKGEQQNIHFKGDWAFVS